MHRGMAGRRKKSNTADNKSSPAKKNKRRGKTQKNKRREKKVKRRGKNKSSPVGARDHATRGC